VSDIFISYSREDSKFVEALIIALIDYGWSVWSDKSGISEGRPYDEQTENAILEATVALVIWSQSSVKSRWVRAEAAYALSRNKLIPIIADGSDPPLQFLHIQGVNLVDWRRTNDDAAFKKLASVLSQRLDRVGRIPQSDNETNLPARTAASSLSGAFSFWKSLRDAAFPPVSAGFEQYYTNRTFFIAQFTCVFGFFLVTLFGLLDFFAPSGGLDQTRFRLIVTGPSLLILLALSFTALAKRHSQTFLMIFGCVLMLLVYKTTKMVDGEFPATTGAPTTTFLIMMVLGTVLPLRTANAAALGLFAFLAHEYYIFKASVPVPPPLLAGYSICVASSWMALVVGSYFRESVMRKSYQDYDQASSKIAELKERLVGLAVERNQTSLPNRSLRNVK